MIRGFRQIALLTALSRILGMLRDVAFAYFLGASGLMDGWAIAFKIPNLARRLFGEGAAASSLIPVYSEQLQRDPKQAHKLAFSVATVIFVLLSLVTLLGEVFISSYCALWAPHEGTKLKLALTGVMLPYILYGRGPSRTCSTPSGCTNSRSAFLGPLWRPPFFPCSARTRRDATSRPCPRRCPGGCKARSLWPCPRP